MMYYLIKNIHLLCVMLSGMGFVLRGAWMLAESPLLRTRSARVLPHVIDTVLLGSAIALAVMSGQYPFVAGWVTAKVLGLLLYIVLGALALRRARTRSARVLALAGAMLVFIWIVSVARSKDPAGFLALARGLW